MKSLFTVLLLCFFSAAFAQQDPSIPPYKRFPDIPGLQLLFMDSTSYTKENLSKKKQVLLMLFNPDCDHCQHETEQLVANKVAFEETQVLMVSTYPLFRLKDFSQKYGLQQMSNVTVTKDPYYLLVSFYAIRSYPYLALYNKKGKLIETFEGNVDMDKVIAAFKNAR